jgi:CheY-like chemotaxis protein
MSVISRLLVLQEDDHTAEAVRFGFEREGASVRAARPGDEVPPLVAELAPELIVAGAGSAQSAVELLAAIRKALELAHEQIPILYLGNGIARAQAIEAGATEFLPQPAYLRDVVTVGKLLASPGPQGGVASGDLRDYHGVFYMVRALAALGRSGVLTLTRGLRRGELRFYEGEVTSAQLGALHGQAALHQLLLWTEAHFELRYESVIRRRQIPLGVDEILQDAERFLAEIQSVAGGLAPSAVYEPDPAELERTVADMPTEVHGVLRLFDGVRSIADVVEDSPFRVIDTVRIATRLRDLGVLRRGGGSRGAARAPLSIGEWLVGDPDATAAPRPVAAVESEPIGPKPGQPASPPRKGKRRRKRKKERGDGEADARPPVSTDWSQLLPSTNVADGAGFSPVVPSSEAVGEIVVRTPSRAQVGAAGEGDDPDEVITAPEREKLEAVVDADARDRLFPAEDAPAAPGAREAGDATAERRSREAEEIALQEARGIAERALAQARAAEAEDRAEREAAPSTAHEGEDEQDDTARLTRPEPAKGEDEQDDTARLTRPEPAKGEDEQDDTARLTRPEPAKTEPEPPVNQPEPRVAAAEPQPETETAIKTKKSRKKRKKKKSGNKAEQAVTSGQAASSGEAAKVEEKPDAAEAKPEGETDTSAGEAPAAADASPDQAAATAGEAPAAADASPDQAAAATGEAPAAADASPDQAAASAEEVPDPDDRTETSGELPMPTAPRGDRPPEDGPSILIADLAAAQQSATAAVKSAGAASGPDVSGSQAGNRATEVAGQVGEVAARGRDVFTDDEEAFFAAGKELEQKAPPPVESFDDLDTGYQPRGFWQRLFSKGPRGEPPPAQARDKKKR